MNGDIECEIRSVVPSEQWDKIFNQLKEAGQFLGSKKRFSVMFFGRKFSPPLDVRVRITNGAAEAVIKKGDFHSPDRTETSLPIKTEQFIDLVKIFYHFGFDIVKAGGRESHHFAFPGDIEITLARGGNYPYLEIEKITTPENYDATEQELKTLAEQLNFTIATADDFYNLCHQLTEEVDWLFNDTPEDYKRLEEELRTYTA